MVELFLGSVHESVITFGQLVAALISLHDLVPEPANASVNQKIGKLFLIPIDDREFQEFKESGKDGIVLGITLNPKQCIGEPLKKNTNKSLKC